MCNIGDIGTCEALYMYVCECLDISFVLLVGEKVDRYIWSRGYDFLTSAVVLFYPMSCTMFLKVGKTLLVVNGAVCIFQPDCVAQVSSSMKPNFY